MADYITSDPLIGGQIVTMSDPVVEDEYSVGMPLVCNGTPDQYEHGTATMPAAGISKQAADARRRNGG